MMKIDSTKVSVVVTCDRCPWWSAFAWTRDEAWIVAARHEERTHPGDKQARDAVRKRATRRVTL